MAANPLSIATDGLLSSEGSSAIQMASMGFISLGGQIIDIPLPPERKRHVGAAAGGSPKRSKTPLHKDPRENYDFVIISSLNKINDKLAALNKKEADVVRFKIKENPADIPKVSASKARVIRENYEIEFHNLVVENKNYQKEVAKISRGIKVLPINVVVSSSFNKRNT